MGYDVPHVCPIDGGGFTPGKMVKVHGTAHATASRFAINIQTGPNLNPRDDIILHISAIFAENALSRASYQSGMWGPEERSGSLPFGRSQPFDLIVMCEADSFKIAINGQHFAEFIHRMPYQRASHLVIEGDLMINHIGWEGGSGGGIGGFAPPPQTGGMYPHLDGGMPSVPYPTGPVPVPPYSGAGYVPPPPPGAAAYNPGIGGYNPAAPGYNPGVPGAGGYNPAAPGMGGYNPAAPAPGYAPQPGYGAPYGGQPGQPGYAPYPGYGGHQPPHPGVGYGPPAPPGYGGQQPYGAPGYGQPGYGPPPPPGYNNDPYYGKQGSSDDIGDFLGKAGSAIAGALGTAGIFGALTGKSKGNHKDSGILGKVGGALGLGAGAAVLGSVLGGKKSHIPGMPHSGGGGMLGKVGTALGLGTGAAALGGAALAGKKSKKSKAMKYGLPIAGLGVGAYAASKVVKGFHGGSSSSSSSSEEE